ncbi:hypothetical protein C351_02298 [Cryptococcus neoformans c8]|nr:hypothetical protein C353_05474 [Cryptococcus neoformans var. grubii AD1-83a]OXG51700.1 hypothetical protein C354_05416 [Cryptococcus neoformans var. grubii MW-RSA1955]OXG55608.1 hypothetical protein C352_05398 [Cryptococcus neoformans var. grubii CHC193]OXG65859.1 hypothetical protein C351_02298 [Cryptococcus neoformans var. grubii c8]
MQAEGSVCKEGASIFEIARFALASVYFPENSPARLYMVATRCRSESGIGHDAFVCREVLLLLLEHFQVALDATG